MKKKMFWLGAFDVLYLKACKQDDDVETTTSLLKA